MGIFAWLHQLAGARTNPANGLPMLNESIDVHGNTIGTTNLDDSLKPADLPASPCGDSDSFPPSSFGGGFGGGFGD